ncbi:MAG TPA: chemotaxis response regulator protein-glutamate methylesterase [Bryobacteraceae bacterium]|jgi:two-component system chemotaxis response regulator CheB|nr:chemotaxis response regulator protein-glutamate methylesterase [Bryobacteraceae bacterium]
MSGKKIRVLIVDDSAIVRRALSEIVGSHPDLEVAGTAADPFVARDKILALKPDVLTLDIEMPRMDGLTFLKKLMRYHPLPVVVISSLGQSSSQAALEALHSGAVEVVAKPGGPYSVTELRDQLALKIRAAAGASLHRPSARVDAQPRAEALRRGVSLIAIGASTGGVEALRAVLASLPAEMPPIVVVQHIPAVFSREFARRLDQICKIRVKEASDGDAAEPGQALIAPGNFHMSLRGERGAYRVTVHGGDPVLYQRPSVDVLFDSAARIAGDQAVGVILTGMGADGAAGMLRMKQAGARTIAQNEATCVVFGMPREAIRIGAADEILPLDQIGAELARYALAAV